MKTMIILETGKIVLNIDLKLKLIIFMYLYRTSGYNRPPTFGRHGAHKHHDSMGEVSIN